MQQITFADKVTGGTPAAVRQLSAADVNEIKNAINPNALELLPAQIIPVTSFETDLVVDTDLVILKFPWDITITNVYAYVKTAPTGSGIIVDLHVEGSTIMTDKITIDATTTDSADAGTPPSIADGDVDAFEAITIDVDQIGSTIAGQELYVVLEMVRR